MNQDLQPQSEHHLVALAQEMKIPMAEVYEVATLYHHFEVLKDDAQARGLTVQVRDGLSCEMAGAKDLLARLPGLLGLADIRVGAAKLITNAALDPFGKIPEFKYCAVAIHKTELAARSEGYGA